MSREQDILRRIKFCMRHQIEVEHGTGRYYVTAISLRWKQSEEFIYSIELTDVNRINTTITVGLDGAEWPDKGGRFILAERKTAD